MKLDAYLDENDEKPDAFAVRAETSLPTIYRIIAGTLWPKRDLWNRIIRETAGRVTPNDHLDTAAQPGVNNDGETTKQDGPSPAADRRQ